MSEGISPNKLNGISKAYLDMVADINKKEQEADVKRWQQEDAKYGYDKQGNSLNPKDIKKRKMKEETECKTESPFKKKKVKESDITDADVKDSKYQREAFSNWRKNLREVTSDAEVVDTQDQNIEKVKEKKVKNKIIINPQFKEAVEEMGGELLEVKEVGADEDPADEKASQKEKKLKLRLLRVKMMAVKQGADDSITAGYEPDIDGAVEYFHEEGINEEGIDQLVEEIGLEAFVDFIEGGTVELNEERDARRATVRAKKYDVVKKEVDKADAARRKSKKGEYAPSYAKKETDVTVYDDKPTAKKKAAPAKKATAPKKPAAPKKPVTKKVVKAVAKVKKSQPAKKPSKPGLRDKIATLYKRGVKRHRKATQAPRVFAKGAASGAKKAVKFIKDVHKAVNEEELKERLGGKGTSRKAGAAKIHPTSGDWEDSDRGAGNKSARRAGKKVEKKSPTYLAHVHNKKVKKEEVYWSSESLDQLDELNRYAKETGKNTGSLNKTAGSPVRKGGSGDKALQTVQRMIRKDYGKPEGQQKKAKGVKSDAGTGKYLAKQKSKKDYAARAKKAGYKNPQDYTNVVARYGGEDNYRKGKGLGT